MCLHQVDEQEFLFTEIGALGSLENYRGAVVVGCRSIEVEKSTETVLERSEGISIS
jgi:hypothetical protein